MTCIWRGTRLIFKVIIGKPDQGDGKTVLLCKRLQKISSRSCLKDIFFRLVEERYYGRDTISKPWPFPEDIPNAMKILRWPLPTTHFICEQWLSIVSQREEWKKNSLKRRYKLVISNKKFTIQISQETTSNLKAGKNNKVSISAPMLGNCRVIYSLLEWGVKDYSLKLLRFYPGRTSVNITAS